MQKNTIIEISTGTIVKSVLFVLLLAGLYYIRDIVAVVLFSIVIASAIEPATNWFEKKRVPRTISVIFIYVVVFSLLGGVFYLVVPTFFSELSTFVVSVPQYLQNPTQFQSFFDFIPVSDGSFSSIIQDVLVGLRDKLGTITTGFFQATASIFGGAVSFLMVIVLSFYLSVQKNGLENFLKIVTPVEYENYILDLWKRSQRKIGLWLQGQVLLGILVGVLVYLGLTILNVEYALSFALLAAVFELIPIFGPIMASIPPIVVAFLQNPSLALAVLILYIIIQQFENHLIYPLVVRKIVGVPPILVILAIIIGGSIGGFFGVLLAIPTATVLKEFLDDVADKKLKAAN
ncbi:MAG: AI-2E family transporter [Patescibacteria group bacterium]